MNYGGWESNDTVKDILHKEMVRQYRLINPNEQRTKQWWRMTMAMMKDNDDDKERRPRFGWTTATATTPGIALIRTTMSNTGGRCIHTCTNTTLLKIVYHFKKVYLSVRMNICGRRRSQRSKSNDTRCRRTIPIAKSIAASLSVSLSISISILLVTKSILFTEVSPHVIWCSVIGQWNGCCWFTSNQQCWL